MKSLILSLQEGEEEEDPNEEAGEAGQMQDDMMGESITSQATSFLKATKALLYHDATQEKVSTPDTTTIKSTSVSLRRTKTKTAFVPSDKEPEDLPEDLDLGDMDEEDGGPEDAGRKQKQIFRKGVDILIFCSK